MDFACALCMTCLTRCLTNNLLFLGNTAPLLLLLEDLSIHIPPSQFDIFWDPPLPQLFLYLKHRTSMGHSVIESDYVSWAEAHSLTLMACLNVSSNTVVLYWNDWWRYNVQYLVYTMNETMNNLTHFEIFDLKLLGLWYWNDLIYREYSSGPCFNLTCVCVLREPVPSCRGGETHLL